MIRIKPQEMATIINWQARFNEINIIIETNLVNNGIWFRQNNKYLTTYYKIAYYGWSLLEDNKISFVNKLTILELLEIEYNKFAKGK